MSCPKLRNDFFYLLFRKEEVGIGVWASAKYCSLLRKRFVSVDKC